MGTIREEIAKSLLYYRKRAKLTQKQLAERLGVSHTAVSNWESGNNSIDIDTLYNACEVFGVTLNDMYGKFSMADSLTDHERKVISAYRESPDMQAAVDRLLNVEPDAPTVGEDIAETVRQFTGKSTVSK